MVKPTLPLFDKRAVVILTLTVALSIVCCLLPALRAIDYPMTLLATLLLSVLFLVCGVLDAPEMPFAPALRRRAMLGLTAQMALCLPVGLASVAAGAVCEPLYGFIFVAAGPLAACLTAYPTGYALGKVVRPRWLALLTSSLLVPATAMVAVGEFLFTPQVRFYGTFFGMYHGAVYDEAVFVELPYLWLRLWNLAGVACLAALLVRGETAVPRLRQRWLAVAGVALAAWITLAAASPYLGYAASYAPLDSHLYESIETDRFIIRFSPEGRAKKTAPLMARDLEFRAMQVDKLFDLSKADRKITVFLYDSPLHKAKLMGAGQTSIAKPWLGELHVHEHEIGATVVAHELAHVMLAVLADSWLGMPTNYGVVPRPGIMEGAAVAIERGGTLLTTHQWAAAMKQLGRQPEMSEILEGLGFWRGSSSLAYTACGSFVRFLLQNYGTRPFAELYGGATFDTAYERPVADLLQAWNRYLETIPLDADELELAAYVFDRQPVFDRQCPYAGGRCLRRAYLAAAAGQGQEAPALARTAMTITRSDIYLGQRFVRLLMAVGRAAEALDIIERIREERWEQLGNTARISLRFAFADAAWLLDRTDIAREVYEALDSEPSAFWLQDSLAFRRALATQQASPEMRRLAVGGYTRLEAPALFERVLADKPRLGAVEQARVGLSLSSFPDFHAEAVELLAASVNRLPQSEVGISRSVVLGLARLEVMCGELISARGRLVGLLQEDLTPVRRELVRAWLERVDWQGKRQTASQDSTW